MGQLKENPLRIAQPERLRGDHRPGVEDDPSLPPSERVERLVSSSDLFVFMKGSPRQPQCGFSANTVAMLDSLGVSYSSFDVLSDEAIRSEAKIYGQWPTFPQVYLKGELIGGNDIVSELFASGELASMVEGVR